MRRAMALILALTLLSGCSSMLEREYVSVTAHVNQTMLADDPSILRVENYQGLVNSVLYFVSQGMESGTIRLTKYTGDPETDLAAACAEVAEEDPLGAYALERVDYTYSLIVSYYECSFTFSYRRTAEQLANLHTVSGSSAIRQELEEALAAHRSDVAFRTSSYYADEDALCALLDDAYQNIGLAALGMPQVELAFYPQYGTGSQRIAELVFSYDQDAAELERQYQSNLQLAQILTAQEYGSDTEAALSFAQAMTYDSEGPSSTYAALAGDGADSLGIALAYQALCEQYGLPCQTVSGTKGDVPCDWNLVQVDGVYRHMDATAMEPVLLSDSQMDDYAWDWDSYPTCPD